MEAKKTIAILGLEKGAEKAFLDRLANANRLLIISENTNDCGKASDYILEDRSEEEVELINCPKDGCWEADIIMLWNPSQHNPEHLLRIQSVAIQKIVLFVLNGEVDNLPSFPHSKIVLLVINSETGETIITGEDSEAVESINDLVGKTEIFKIIKHRTY